MNKNLIEQGWKEISLEIKWNECQMTTGFPEIDTQHKEWICRFNEFNNAVINHRGEQVCTKTLLFFLRYSETHFRFEEALMKQYHCPAEALNKAEHDKFRRRIEELMYMTWPLGATPEDIIKLQKEMADWLRHHMCSVDLQLRDVAKNLRSTSSWDFL